MLQRQGRNRECRVLYCTTIFFEKYILNLSALDHIQMLFCEAYKESSGFCYRASEFCF